MKLLGTSIALAVIASGVAIAPAPVAQANSTCVTRAERRAVAGHHYIMPRVHRIYGQMGIRTYFGYYNEYAGQETVRAYQRCDQEYPPLYVLYRRHMHWTEGADSHLEYGYWRRTRTVAPQDN